MERGRGGRNAKNFRRDSGFKALSAKEQRKKPETTRHDAQTETDLDHELSTMNEHMF